MALLACACSIYAQSGKSYLIETFAGTAPYDEGIPAVSALLNASALTFAPDGSVYVASVSSLAAHPPVAPEPTTIASKGSLLEII